MFSSSCYPILLVRRNNSPHLGPGDVFISKSGAPFAPFAFGDFPGFKRKTPECGAPLHDCFTRASPPLEKGRSAFRRNAGWGSRRTDPLPNRPKGPQPLWTLFKGRESRLQNSQCQRAHADEGFARPAHEHLRRPLRCLRRPVEWEPVAMALAFIDAGMEYKASRQVFDIYRPNAGFKAEYPPWVESTDLCSTYSSVGLCAFPPPLAGEVSPKATEGVEVCTDKTPFGRFGPLEGVGAPSNPP